MNQTPSGPEPGRHVPPVETYQCCTCGGGGLDSYGDTCLHCNGTGLC